MIWGVAWHYSGLFLFDARKKGHVPIFILMFNKIALVPSKFSIKTNKQNNNFLKGKKQGQIWDYPMLNVVELQKRKKNEKSKLLSNMNIAKGCLVLHEEKEGTQIRKTVVAELTSVQLWKGSTSKCKI